MITTVPLVGVTFASLCTHKVLSTVGQVLMNDGFFVPEVRLSAVVVGTHNR